MATGWPMKTTYANGDVYSASDVNDITGTINLLGQSVAYTAGKNKIINGDFNVNQRNFTSSTTNNAYGFDRFYFEFYGGTSTTYSAQTFTAGTAPVSGYEAKNYARIVTAGQANAADYAAIGQKIENVRTLAGQTATVSFWAKASTGTPKIEPTFGQVFGTGGSSTVIVKTAPITISTSWVRYSATVAIPSISGKTIGTNDELRLWIFTSAGTSMSSYSTVGLQNATIDIWGIQVEQGSTATAFQTASGTIQGELALCQRYYRRLDATGQNTATLVSGLAFSTTVAMFIFPFGIEMRIAPSSIDVSNQGTYRPANGTAYSGGTWALNQAMTCSARVIYTHGSAVYTAGESLITSSTNSSNYIAFSAEL